MKRDLNVTPPTELPSSTFEMRTHGQLFSLLNSIANQLKLLECDFLLMMESREGLKLRIGRGTLKTLLDSYPFAAHYRDVDQNVNAWTLVDDSSVKSPIFLTETDLPFDDPDSLSQSANERCDSSRDSHPDGSSRALDSPSAASGRDSDWSQLVILPEDFENNSVVSSVRFAEDGENGHERYDDDPGSETNISNAGGAPAIESRRAWEREVNDKTYETPTTRKEESISVPVVRSEEETKKRNYRCHDCGKLFEKRFYFENHKKSHERNESEPELFFCAVCRTEFKTAQTLKAHNRARHDLFNCFVCSADFADYDRLVSHFQRLHVEMLFECGVCAKVFLSARSLGSHEKIHVAKRSLGNLKPPRCARCKKHHDLTTSCARDMSCQKCGKTFARVSHLRDHMVAHSDDTPFACDRCDSRFKMKRALNAHLVAVHGRSNVTCRYCAKSFKSLRYLKAHERNIHGERNFACNVCSLAFANAAFLKSHLKIHVGKTDVVKTDVGIGS